MSWQLPGRLMSSWQGTISSQGPGLGPSMTPPQSLQGPRVTQMMQVTQWQRHAQRRNEGLSCHCIRIGGRTGASEDRQIWNEIGDNKERK